MGTLTEVARFYDPEEAYCAKGYLNSYGIDTVVQNEHHLTTAPYLRVALGGYGLLVRDDLKSDAVRALDKIESPPAPQYAKPKNWVWFPIAFAGAVPFLPKQRTGVIGLFQIFVLATFYFVLLFFVLRWVR